MAWDRSHGLNFLTYARALLSLYLGHGVGYFVGTESGFSVSHRPAKSATLTYYFRAGKEKEGFEMTYIGRFVVCGSFAADAERKDLSTFLLALANINFDSSRSLSLM